MRLTIIPSDGCVVIDNYFFTNLDLSSCEIPFDVHALQWYETEGEIEFSLNQERFKPANELIKSLPNWANKCLDAWNIAKQAELDALAQAQRDALANQSNEIPATQI